MLYILRMLIWVYVLAIALILLRPYCAFAELRRSKAGLDLNFPNGYQSFAPTGLNMMGKIIWSQIKV